MNRRSFAATLMAGPAIGAAAWAGWRFVQARSAASCWACTRPVHDHMRTVAEVNGHSAEYCCPACALSEHRQSGSPVKVTVLTDYLTITAIQPARAFIVQASDVNPCKSHAAPAVASDKQPLRSGFDRCSPSMLAFRDEASARSFASAHGGTVVAFNSVAAEYAA